MSYPKTTKKKSAKKRAPEASSSSPATELKEPQLWWACHKTDYQRKPHEFIVPRVDEFDRTEGWRREAWRRYVSLYGENVAALGDTTSGWDQDDLLRVNFLANLVDTAHAQIYRNRILPSPQVTDANYLEMERARLYARFLKGLYES